MNKLKKKILIKRSLYILYNIALLSIAFLFDRFFQMLIFILFYNLIQNCFYYRFHADTLFPNDPIKAVRYCKLITIVVEITYMIFCKELNVSVYSNLFIILIIAIINALLQSFCEKFIYNCSQLKSYSSLKTVLDANNISELNQHRMIEHYINNKTISQIAKEEYVEEITIKQAIRRTRKKLGL